MPQEIQIDYLKFTIPTLSDPVSANTAFSDYANSIMSPSITPVENNPEVITEIHINTVLIYNTTENPLNVFIKPGLPKGAQFSIFCESGAVKVNPTANATEIIIPVNTIQAGKVATFTKIREGSDSSWIMSVGG